MIFKINEQGNGITSILGSFKAKLISFSHDITQDLNVDTKALSQYLRMVSQGSEKNVAFTASMTNASQSMQEYAQKVDLSSLSTQKINGYIKEYRNQQTQSNVALIAQNKSLSNCRSIIATYNKGYEQLGLTQEQFVDSVKQGNSNLGKYLSTVKNGNASWIGYTGSLIKAKVATIGLRVATMALNSVLSLAVSALISWGLQGISDWIHSAEKAAERAKEAAQSIQELKDSFDSLDEYQKKINDINDALDSGALSHQEAKDKREELMSIQDEIIQKYGKEKGAIDTITDAIHGERDALNEVKQLEAEKWNREHQDEIQEALDFLNNDITLSVLWNGRDSWGSREILTEQAFNSYKASGLNSSMPWNTWEDYLLEPTQFVQQWVKQHPNMSLGSNDITSQINFTGTRTEILESYNEFFTAIDEFIDENYSKLSEKQIEQYENLKTGISESIKYINEGANGDNAYNNNKDVLRQGIENAIITDNELKTLYSDYQTAISDYRTAETTGDEQRIAEAYQNERDAFQALLNASKDVGKFKKEQIDNWIKDTQSEFDKATDHERLVIDVQTELKMNTGVSSYIDAWVKENQKSYEDLIDEVDDESSPIGTMIQSYVDTFNSVADEMGVAKISVEDYINALLRLGIVQKEVSAEAKENQPFVLDKDQSSTLKSINSDIDKLNDAYSKLFNNKLTDNDVYELIELFPQLGDYVDFTADKYGNLAEGIDAVIKTRPQDLIDELEKIDKSTLTEQGRKFLEYTINSLKSVHAELKVTDSYLKNISSVISTLIGLEKELDENGSLSLSSIDTIMTDDAYKSLRPLINDIPKLKEAIKSLTEEQKKAYEELYNEEQEKQYLSKKNVAERVKTIQDEVTEIKKKYDIDTDNWEDLQNTKRELLINTNNEILFKQNQAINDFARLYGVDLSNFSDAVKAKEEIMRNFYRSQAFQDVRNIVGNSLTYDPTSGRLNINSDSKRQQVNAILASQGLTWEDYLSYLQGTGFTTAGSSQMEKIIQDIIGKYTPTTINWDKATANIKSSGGSSSSTSTTKQFFDWIERRLKKLANDTKQTFAKVADYISFTGKNNQLSKAISSLMNEASANQEAYNKYMSYANAVQLDDYYKWQVRNGSMQIDQIQDTNLQEAINKYKEYYDAAMSCADAVEDLKKQEKEYGEQMLSNIEKYFNNRIQYAASSADYYNSLDTSNLYRSKNFDEIRKSYKKQIAETQNEASNLRATLNSLISWRLVKEGDDVWYEWRDKIDKCDLSVRNLQKSVRDLANEELKVIQSDFENKINSSQNAVSKINAFAGDDTRNAKKDYAGLTREYNSQISYTSQMVDKLRKRLNTAVNNGDIEKYSDTWYEWTGVIEKGEADIIDLKKNVHELSVEQFNDIQKIYEHQLSAFEKTAKTYENKNKELELRGRLSSKKYYEALTQNETQNIKAMEREATALQEQLTKAMLSGNVQAGSEQWYTMRDAIDSVNESIAEGRLTLLEYSKTIREIEWGYFDFLLDRISQINGEADFLIDLMSNSKLFSDSGNITSKGRASMGLHVQNYDVYMAQADMYAAEIIKVNRQLANDPSNTEILKRREELLKLQQQSITSAEKEKTAIVDLVKNGIDLQLSSLKKLIDEYTKSLDQAKNLYEYQKNISDKTENIAKIRKQIAAYENDASEETRTKIQQLQISLKEAEQDLEETEYDKFISDTKELLDDLYEDYEKILNDRLDNIDKLFADMVDVVNGSSSEISATIKSAANDVGYSLSKYITDIWSGQNKVTSDYNANFLSGITNVNSVLKSIEYYVSRLVDGTVPNGQTGAAASYTTKTSSGSGTSSGGGSVNVTQYSRGGSTGISNNTSVNSSKTSAVTKSSSTSVSSSGKATTTSTSTSNRSMKEMYGVALAIINGNYGWGAGDIRKKNLLAKGFDYDTIQTIVNKIWKDGYIAGADWKGRYYGITDLSAYDIKRYKNGGLVNYTGLAQVDGTASKPEAFLDAEDTKNIGKLLAQMRGMSMMSYNGVGNYNPFSALLGKQLSQTENGFQIGNVANNISIYIDHVQDYNDFVTKLQQDNKFENMIQDMTIRRLNGNSSLAKNRYIWH